ncbi:MAG TPA: hypothetical protein DCK87_02185, partial [Desulfotomaculum sp.]|nr:hypothetical protein [Desulfotomaculum sp.]
MNLFDFEEHIANKILDRGWDYFQNDNISSLVKEDENSYIAIVEGTDDYTVEVEIDGDNNIAYSSCNCPYDMGPLCKHEVAVFYALRQMLEQGKDCETIGSAVEMTASPVKSKKKSPSAKESPYDRFVSIISSQSKDKLVQFLVSLSVENDQIGRKVELEFGAGDIEQECKNCIALIRSCIRQHTDRHGFISYSETYGATEGAKMAFERAQQAAEDNDYTRAANLYLCILHEMVPLLQSADDSYGDIGAVIEESISALQELAGIDMPADISEYVFQKILSESSNNIYEGWTDWKLDLLEASSQLTDNTERRKTFEKHLDSFTDELDDSWSSQHLAERIAMIRYQLLLEHEGEISAKKFMEQNIGFSFFREMAVKKALSKKEYGLAEKLALEGEQYDRGMQGLINKWKELRYETYRLAGQLEKQRSIAEEFIAAGSFDYYLKLKSTYSKDEWASVYPDIIKSLENQKDYSGNYTKILIEENELHKLLDYVKTEPFYIMEYYKHLLPAFSDEVYQIFVEYILNEAKIAKNRRDYQEVCSCIRL